MTNREKQKIVKYRNKHPRCRYCKFLKKEKSHEYIYDGVAFGDYYDIIRHKCEAKNEYIMLNNHFKGCFCKIFESKELTIDEI